jgi:hypothetical protein
MYLLPCQGPLKRCDTSLLLYVLVGQSSKGRRVPRDILGINRNRHAASMVQRGGETDEPKPLPPFHHSTIPPFFLTQSVWQGVGCMLIALFGPPWPALPPALAPLSTSRIGKMALPENPDKEETNARQKDTAALFFSVQSTTGYEKAMTVPTDCSIGSAIAGIV